MKLSHGLKKCMLGESTNASNVFTHINQETRAKTISVNGHYMDLNNWFLFLLSLVTFVTPCQFQVVIKGQFTGESGCKIYFATRDKVDDTINKKFN